jgi:ParB-like chromosome segregation protein Spo0J
MTVYKIDPELKAELDKYLPPLPEEKFQKLKAKIAKDGYDEAKPIAIWEERPNTIVDGHHRYRACRELGIEPVVVEKSFESIDDAVLYAIDGYLTGRELTVAQTVIAIEHATSIEEKLRLKEAAKAQQGKRTDLNISATGAEKCEVAQKIADKAGVNVRRVYEVHAVRDKGVPELNKMLEAGELGSAYGNTFVQKIPDKATQAEIIKSGGADAVKEVVHKIRVAQSEKNKALQEAERERKFQEEFKEIAAMKKPRTNGCSLGEVQEWLCNLCGCPFDIISREHVAKMCPACGESNFKHREYDPAKWKVET